MSFIAEYTIPNPIMKAAREHVPSVTVTVEDELPDSDANSQIIFWARGEESHLEQFFQVLPDDPSLITFELLATLPEQRLFRVTLSPMGERGVTYIDAIDLGITLLEIEAKGVDMDYRAQVPSREALVRYRDRCEERGLSFTLRRLYRSKEEQTAKYGLTDRQRDVLDRAFERGYFEVPREISTAELAEEFEISSQALSALIRRGQKALVRNTIATDSEYINH